jgi:hypothetical protein
MEVSDTRSDTLRKVRKCCLFYVQKRAVRFGLRMSKGGGGFSELVFTRLRWYAHQEEVVE